MNASAKRKSKPTPRCANCGRTERHWEGCAHTQCRHRPAWQASGYELESRFRDDTMRREDER